MKYTDKVLSLSEIQPYQKNAKKHPPEQVANIAESIRQFGWTQPIVVDEDGEIIIGHGRFAAAKKLGLMEAPCRVLSGLSDEKKRELRLIDNKTNESDWDLDLLAEDLEGLDFDGFDLDFGIGGGEVDKLGFDEVEHSTLSEKFIFALFSVLDGRTGKWQDRKNSWLDLGIRSDIGRDKGLIGGLKQCAEEFASGSSFKGTSIFDPVVCELMYKWFNVKNGVVFDPFAGGSVRGIVAVKLGCKYTGIDLRQEQIDANRNNASELNCAPNWICDDSRNADKYVKDDSVDMVFSCPPYADLEVYSDDPRDLSNMDYNAFLSAYREIIRVSLKKLKQDRFAVFVVGDVRGKDGCYYDFISDTKKAFIDCGAKLYNEIIKLDALATAPVRAALQMKNRKVVKVHQNILVFYKGDPKNIRNNYNEIDVGDVSDYQDIEEE